MYLLANQNDKAQGAGCGCGGNKAVLNGRSHNFEELKVTFHFLSVPRKLPCVGACLTSAVHVITFISLNFKILNIKHTRNIF
jgi:hypothetical protein